MKRLSLIGAGICLAGLVGGASAAFDVTVELENLSGEAKANWPIILTVYQVCGRNLPAEAINPKGFHVYDQAGQELACAVETMQPHIHPGGDELIFVVPKMDANQKLAYRIANTPGDSGKMTAIDVVGNPNNLVKNGGFEEGQGKTIAGFSGQGELDAQTKHAGKSAFLLAGKSRMQAAYANKIALHPGSWYYAGVWSKTENIARYGVAAGSGGYFKLTGLESQNAAGASIAPTCYTRDWNKLHLFARYALFRNDWGIENNTIKAVADSMNIEIGLDQKKQFTMDNDGSGKWWLDDMVVMEQPKVTVRFDRLLEPLMKDGYFLFTRPTSSPIGDAPPAPKEKQVQPWAPLPFPHEAVGQIDRFAVKGQRALYLVGLYHTRAMDKVVMKVKDGALRGAGGAKIPVETVEYSYGVLGEAPHYYLLNMTDPLNFAGPKGQRYLLATFLVPRDAAPGKYAGALTVSEGDKVLKEIPISLAVQDMVQPVLKDRWIGSIFQASPMVFTEESIGVYGRSGYSCVTIFGSFFKFNKDNDGLMHVDLADLAVKMGWLMKNGLTAISLYSDVQLDDKPRGPGRIAGYAYREAGASKEAVALKSALDTATAARKKAAEEAAANKGDTARQAALKEAAAKEAAAREAHEGLFKKAYIRILQEFGAECRKHPEWPRIIHMNWDEASGPNPKMGYSAEAIPEAETTADLGFGVIPSCSKYFTLPCIDDPADFSGPELYNWIKKQGKKVGIAASSRKDEFARYQVGVLAASADIRYLHSWHVEGLMTFIKVDGKTKKVCRSLGLVAAGEGMDDLKTFVLLTDAIARGRAGGDARIKAIADEADTFLKKTFQVWNGDHAQASGNPPYFGLAGSWGYDRFYDDFQGKMARYAAALSGVKWVE